MYEKLTKHSQGRRHNLKSGGTNITASEAGRKNLGVVLCVIPRNVVCGAQPPICDICTPTLKITLELHFMQIKIYINR